MPPAAPTAFFSYSRADSAFALRLAEDLKTAGADIWLDQLDIAPGRRWARAVQEALQNPPRVLVTAAHADAAGKASEEQVGEERKRVAWARQEEEQGRVAAEKSRPEEKRRNFGGR